jgi:hypothetical protein
VFWRNFDLRALTSVETSGALRRRSLLADRGSLLGR